MPNTIIARQILDSLLTESYMEEAEQVGSFGYKGLTITLYTNRSCEGSLFVEMVGLGHILHMLYKFELDNQREPAIADVGIFYSDFCDYVLYEREETHATKH